MKLCQHSCDRKQVLCKNLKEDAIYSQLSLAKKLYSCINVPEGI